MRSIAASVLVLLTLVGCAARSERDGGWATLLDASRLAEWHRLGNANWRVVDGAIQADAGEGYLVSTNAYRDFQVRVEFWVDDAANSGVFLRMTNRAEVTPMNSYEVNVFDRRPDPTYGTGAIVGVAKVSKPQKAGGRWNTYFITAKGSHMTVVLNGVETVSVEDDRFASGPIGLQYGGGVVRFRKVEVRTL